jgi:hypothetical protein
VLSHANSQARDRFLTSGLLGTSLRDLVAESWQRCLRQGVTPDGPNPLVDLTDDDLAEYRAAHPLAAVMPVVRRLLVEDATDADLIVAVSDAAGRLLWVEGAPALRRRAERMNFLEGALWSEAAAGTNAPGTALAMDHALQIFGAEHLMSPVTPWSCTAAPIHAPDGALLGALDVTGGDEVAAPHTLRLVSAVAAAVEAELRAGHPSPGLIGIGRRRSVDVGPAASGYPRLEVLGRPHADLHPAGGSSTGSGTGTALRLRHAEILLVLSRHPEGLSAEELEVALHEDPSAAVTTRAEISRLRTLLGRAGGPTIRSRPYRLDPNPVTDLDEVRGLLDGGRPEAALARYPGPVLPRSQAPAVVRLREDLHQDLRAAVIVRADADALWVLAHRPENEWDVELWRSCLHRLPAGSPRRAVVVGRLTRLDRDLGVRNR